MSWIDWLSIWIFCKVDATRVVFKVSSSPFDSSYWLSVARWEDGGWFFT